MNVFLWNARARNTHVEATLNHPFPAQAKKRWDETVAWRADGNRPEAVQFTPQPNFDVIKASHKHFFHKRDKLGHLCSYEVIDRAGKGCEIPNFKGSYLGRFPLVLADFSTSDHLSERSRSVNVVSGTRARGTPTLKRR